MYPKRSWKDTEESSGTKTRKAVVYTPYMTAAKRHKISPPRVSLPPSLRSARPTKIVPPIDNNNPPIFTHANLSNPRQVENKKVQREEVVLIIVLLVTLVWARETL